MGAFCSGLAGYIGMFIAVRSNVRTASAAQRSLKEAITVSLRGGAVSGFLVVALSLIGVSTHLRRLQRAYSITRARLRRS